MFQESTEGASVGGEKKDIRGVKLNVDVDFSEYITGLGTAKDIAAVLKSNTVDIFNEFASSYSKLENQARQVATLFGGSRAFAQDLKRSIADVTPEIVALGGSMQDVRDMQIETMKNMNTQISLSKDQTTELFAASSLVAGTGENIGKVSAEAQRKFVDAGYSISDTGSQLLGIINTARELGVSTVSVYKQIGENINRLNLFNFENGVQGMAKMAAEASLLRIDMKTSLGLADKLYDPDQAIKMAATFQRLGTTVTSLLDPYKLMDMARNDPAKLQEEVGKALSQYTYFNEQTKKMEFTDFGRAQIRELSKDMGIPMEQLSQWGLATSDISMKMEKIKFPSEFASEKDRKMISGLASMATEGEFKGEYVVNIGGKEKLVSQLDKDDRAALEKGTEPAKTAVELQLEANGLLASLVNYAKAGIGVGGLQLAASQKVGNVMDTYFGVQQDITKATTSFITGMETKKTGPGAGSLPDVQGVKDRLIRIQEDASELMDAAMQGNGEAISKILVDLGKDATSSLEKNYSEAIKGIKERLEKEGMSKADIDKIVSGMSKIGSNIGVAFDAQVKKTKADIKAKAVDMGLTPEVQEELEKKYDEFTKSFGNVVDAVKVKLSGLGESFSEATEKLTGIKVPTKEEIKEKANEIAEGVSGVYGDLKKSAEETLSTKSEAEKTPPPTRSTGEIKTESTVPVNPPVAEEKTKTEEFHFSREGLTMEEMAVELDNYTKKTFGDSRLYGGKKTETIKAEPPPKKEETIKITEPTFKETEIKEPTFKTVTSEKPKESETIKITEPTFKETEIKEPTFKTVTSEKPKESETIKITEPTFKETEIKEPTFKEVMSEKPKAPEPIKITEPTFKETEIKEPTFKEITSEKPKAPEPIKITETVITKEEIKEPTLNQMALQRKEPERIIAGQPPSEKPMMSEETKSYENLGEVITRTIKTPDLTAQFQVFAEMYGGKIKESTDRQTSTLTQYANSIPQPVTPNQELTETGTELTLNQLQKETNTHLATLVNYAKSQVDIMSIEKEGTPIEKLVSTGIEPYVTESTLDKIMSKKEIGEVEQKPQTSITEFKPIIQAPEMTGLEDTFKKIEETMSALKSKSFKEVVEIKMPETTGNTETPVELTALTSVVGQSISNTNSLISTLGKSEETKVVESTTTGTPETVEVSPLKSYGEDYLGRIEKQIATIVPLRATAEVVPTLPESPSVAAVEKINEKTTTETLSKSEHKSEVNGNIKFDFNINQSEFMNSLMTATKNTAFVKEMEASLSQLSQDREKILGTAKQRA